MVIRFFEIALVLFVIWTLISQVIIPALFNTHMFPIFQREQKLKHVIVDLNQELTEQSLEKAIAELSVKVESNKTAEVPTEAQPSVVQQTEGEKV